MFRFEHPEHLYALLLIPLLIGLGVWAGIRRDKALRELGDRKTLIRMMPGWSARGQWFRWAILFAALLFLVVGWANPQWGTKRQKAVRKAADVMIALDISQSMLVEDIAPNRMEQAKLFASRLVEGLQGERIGLVVFAGGAYLQTPLTTDYGALDIFIRSSAPEQAPYQGTSIGAAIDLGMRLFEPEKNNHKAIIVISDGETHDEDAVQKAQAAKAQGALIFTVAVGTEAGGFVPEIIDGRKVYKKDRSGEPVRSQVDPAALRQIAAEGGGQFFALRNAGPVVSAIRKAVDQLDRRDLEERVYDEYESYFQYFIAIGLILLFLEFSAPFRRAKPYAAIGLFFFFLPALSAQTAHDHLRAGDKAYKAQDFKKAEEQYRKALEKTPSAQGQYNLGSSTYRQQRFDEAIEQFQQAAGQSADPGVRAKAYHNLGNAHYEKQQYQEAVEAYKNALRLQPSDPQTQYNLSQALRQMRIQQQQQEQGQDQQQGQEQEQEENQESQQNDSDQQPQEGESGDDERQGESPRQQEKSGPLSDEEAERLLEIMNREEQNVQKKMRKQEGKPARPERDWR
jgi:tetratricopeptide (TPR) repeat protein